MWNFLNKYKEIENFNSDEARKLSGKITNKLELKQLNKVLLYIKYNSIAGHKKKNYGWFFSKESSDPLNRLDNLYPEVIEELKSRGFTVGEPQKGKQWDAEIEEFNPYIKCEIGW